MQQNSMNPTGIRYVDSHTEGEPTRTLIEGFPELAGNTIGEKASHFKNSAFWNDLRRGVLLEPRGFPAMVGAILLEPVRDGGPKGLIFFNNKTTLQMCGHGLIGVVRTLQYLDRGADEFWFETTAGEVRAKALEDGTIEIENVESYVFKQDVAVETAAYGTVLGDVAWGGNWFFLARNDFGPIGMDRIPELTGISSEIMKSLAAQGITGEGNAEIDHVELFGSSENFNSRNFVLCPGGEYDRSPCGTGTSAKLACLARRGELDAGSVWKQESVTGGVFGARYEKSARGVMPKISGRAFITSEGRFVFENGDPFRFGIGS
ncbi:MAG: proline racemase family protein [Pyrinomonadaceae bacterium]